MAGCSGGDIEMGAEPITGRQYNYANRCSKCYSPVTSIGMENSVLGSILLENFMSMRVFRSVIIAFPPVLVL
jgi:hypothetical protein